MKTYRERKSNMAFIDLEKVYDIVPRLVSWWVLKKNIIQIL